MQSVPTCRRVVNPSAPAGMHSASCRWRAFRKHGHIGNCAAIKCAVGQAPSRVSCGKQAIGRARTEGHNMKRVLVFVLKRYGIAVVGRSDAANYSVTYSGRI